MRSAGEGVTPPALEGRERFSAFVAHELRGPIALQRALVEVALADPDADAARLREMAERVAESCVHQQRLIEALLDLVRSAAGRSRRERVDLAATATRALEAQPDRVETRVVLEPAWTCGDPDLLERLVANLVSNATRHNVVGGRIEVATGTRSRRTFLSVVNTGPTIPVAELERLFQPGQRLASHRDDGDDGVGLGLAIVQAIADAHDALVWAQPRPGGGLRVDVDFRSVGPPLHASDRQRPVT